MRDWTQGGFTLIVGYLCIMGQLLVYIIVTESTALVISMLLVAIFSLIPLLLFFGKLLDWVWILELFVVFLFIYLEY